LSTVTCPQTEGEASISLTARQRRQAAVRAELEAVLRQALPTDLLAVCCFSGEELEKSSLSALTACQGLQSSRGKGYLHAIQCKTISS